MIIHALDMSGDWTFGRGKGNYLRQSAAVAEAVRGRLLSFYQDCFFDAEAGIDWLNLLGTNDEAALVYSVRAVILGTQGVASLEEVSAVRDADRRLTLSYTITTDFGISVTEQSFQLPVTPFSGVSKFTADLLFSGQDHIDVDVSSRINDARTAVWILYDEGDGFTPVLGAVQPLSASVVRVTIEPVRTGTFRLVGIS